jgi:hypothetical protein
MVEHLTQRTIKAVKDAASKVSNNGSGEALQYGAALSGAIGSGIFIFAHNMQQNRGWEIVDTVFYLVVLFTFAVAVQGWYSSTKDIPKRVVTTFICVLFTANGLFHTARGVGQTQATRTQVSFVYDNTYTYASAFPRLPEIQLYRNPQPIFQRKTGRVKIYLNGIVSIDQRTGWAVVVRNKRSGAF